MAHPPRPSTHDFTSRPAVRLPLVHGFEGEAELAVRRTGCGACCKTLRVAVTHHDVARLAHATGRPATELVEWLAPDEVDMTGEPETFVELGAGRRLLVLAQRDGACALLGADQRC